MVYTAVPTQSTGDLWTAAQHNEYIRDNLAEMIVARIKRQGGSATDWTSSGTTEYTPTSVKVQIGTLGILSPATITFPDAYSDKPIVLVTIGSDNDINVRVYSVTATTFTVRTEGDAAATINWLAIGPP